MWEWTDGTELYHSDYLMHYGKGHDDNPPGRGSGRYPWGSGKENKITEHNKVLAKQVDKISVRPNLMSSKYFTSKKSRSAASQKIFDEIDNACKNDYELNKSRVKAQLTLILGSSNPTYHYKEQIAEHFHKILGNEDKKVAKTWLYSDIIAELASDRAIFEVLNLENKYGENRTDYMIAKIVGDYIRSTDKFKKESKRYIDDSYLLFEIDDHADEYKDYEKLHSKYANILMKSRQKYADAIFKELDLKVEGKVKDQLYEAFGMAIDRQY